MPPDADLTGGRREDSPRGSAAVQPPTPAASGNALARPAGRRVRTGWLVAAALGAAVLVIATVIVLTQRPTAPGPTAGTSPGSTMLPATSTTPSPGPSDAGPSGSPHQTPVPPAPSGSSAGAGTTPGAPPSASGTPGVSGPVVTGLKYGQTASLQYFTVSAQAPRSNPDGTRIGWLVQVCSVRTGPFSEADGTTRVSLDPWLVEVIDGEGGVRPEWIRFTDLPPGAAFQPVYGARYLKPGQCQRGYIQSDHGNPDLLWLGLRYAPASTGDQVTWRP